MAIVRNYHGLHWTQTPEGKAKMSRALRKAAKKRRAEATAKLHNELKGLNGNAETHSETITVVPSEVKIITQARPRLGAEIPDGEISHTAGKIEQLFEIRARCMGVSANAYAFRVLEYIATQTSW